MISEKMETVLKALENSCTTEATAVAECLRGIATNQNDDDDIPYDSDAFLLACAEEIREWALMVIQRVK